MSDALRCWNCGRVLEDVPLPVSRHEHCGRCGEPLHCCRMCLHYDAGVAGQCREDRTEPPAVKEAANFCDYFTPWLQGPARAGAAREAAAREAAARAELEALFGDAPEAGNGPAAEDAPQPSQRTAADRARARLDALFESGQDEPGPE